MRSYLQGQSHYWHITICFSLMLFLMVGCQDQEPFVATFDTQDSWSSGSDIDKEGSVKNGVYDFYVKSDDGHFWATAGIDTFGNGIYEVEATQLDGPLDNGYGMVFKVEENAGNFYLFKVSGDGYIWLGWCENGCETEMPLIGEGWIESPIVKQGTNATNTLRAEINSNTLVFSLNGQEVGRTTNTYGKNTGGVGLYVQTLGLGGVRIAFDNFRYTPSNTE